jgi:hypothetical protein
MIKCEILWKGNPISVVKTFGKATCALCNKVCAIERDWRLSKSPNQPPVYLSTPARRYTACANTNQGSIGTMNRKPPVLMIARSVKKLIWKHRIPQEEEESI